MKSPHKITLSIRDLENIEATSTTKVITDLKKIVAGLQIHMQEEEDKRWTKEEELRKKGKKD